MNTTILDDPISYITYIFKVPSMSPIADQFTMDAHRNIYMLVIDNKEPLLASTAVQLLWYKQKRARYSYVLLTLAHRHPSLINYLE